jgi:hypothetical protein
LIVVIIGAVFVLVREEEGGAVRAGGRLVVLGCRARGSPEPGLPGIVRKIIHDVDHVG